MTAKVVIDLREHLRTDHLVRERWLDAEVPSEWTKWHNFDHLDPLTTHTHPEEPSHLYRKKPVVIEAWRNASDGARTYADVYTLARWCGGFVRTGGSIVIPTLEGEMVASPGDWIIKGIAGEFYPCKPDIFEATYEQADLSPNGSNGE